MASTLKLDSLTNAASGAALDRVVQSAPKWITIALVVVIGWQLANILFALFDTPGGGDIAAPIAGPTSTETQSGAGATVELETIRNAKLFGELNADEPAPQVVNTDPVGETNLNLELKGTIAADDPDKARAIIADAQRKEKVYAVKDTISNGVTLHAVELERVILNQSGRLTSLNLPTEFKGASRPTRSVARPTRAAASNRSSTPSVRDALTQNVSSLTDIIRPQPYFQAGQQKGYRVYPGKDRKKFAALGLRPGDLVTQINGTPMSDPRQGMQVFRSLGDATSVNVTIERNGQPQNLTLTTDQLDLSPQQQQSN